MRTEGIVSVDVLDHVTYSDGTTVSLQNDLQYDKNTFKGLVFVSGDTVRYQATRQTGSFPVTYTVKDNLGNAASATITINVHQKGRVQQGGSDTVRRRGAGGGRSEGADSDHAHRHRR